MSSFANLKRNRSSLEKLTKAIESSGTVESGSKDDTRFWQPQVDKAGNGMAVIRFLPAPAADGDEALPWIRIFSHGFQGPGGWMIDNCLTTINEKCPVCEHNSTLWNSGIEDNKDVARKQKRKISYISNILVISDPSNKENEGKVFLFKYGKKIFDKLTEAMNPEFADESPVNPFDMWEGANFKLKIRNVDGYRNYDKSEFTDKVELFDGDDGKLETLWKSEYSLKQFLESENFKSYDALKSKLNKALGFEGVKPKTKATDSFDNEDDDVDNAILGKKSSEEDGDDLDYFKSLAESD